MYHIQFEWSGGHANAVVVAENDEKAFQYAEQQLERQLLKLSHVNQCYITAKVPLERGRGFVFIQE